MALHVEESSDYLKYVSQLERRVEEQAQLICLLNEKLAGYESASESHPVVDDDTTRVHDRQKKDERSSVTFIGSRKSEMVRSVVNKKYTQYFVTRVNPDVSAEVLARDLLSSMEGLSSVRCSRMKTKHTSYASFHIVIPSELSHLVESDGAWPEGSFVKIFSGRLLENYILEFFDSDRSVSVSNGSGVEDRPPAKKTTNSPAKHTGSSSELRRRSGGVTSPWNSSVRGLKSMVKPIKPNSQCSDGGPAANGNNKLRPVRMQPVDSVSPKNVRRTRQMVKIS